MRKVKKWIVLQRFDKYYWKDAFFVLNENASSNTLTLNFTLTLSSLKSWIENSEGY